MTDIQTAGSADLTLVSDPTRAGLTIIPTTTPLTRLNYFDGKFLRADDLRLDQTYERLLVALAARGDGSGVVHGFEFEQLGNGGDAAVLRGGLARTPSGRVLYLPSDATLSIAALLSRSGDASFDPSDPPAAGSATFGPCATPGAQPPDVTLTPQPVYVVTLAADEALCGEEERFGELCSDACLTDTDRPRLVEGVRVRARVLDLGALPISSTVPFTALHYRSRVATAYFAAERQSVPDLISALGLASPAWCAGADPADGDEVPVAILAAAGGTVQFVDLWTARRELMVQPARRYWAMRMAMRPWDVFLAQILQFQCQLRDAAAVVGTGVDPCADERSALRSMRDVIAEISTRFDVDKTTLQRYRTLIDDATPLLDPPGAPTSGTPTSGTLPSGTPSSGSLLVDHGIVTTPSAGYLPVDPAGDVPAQVRAQFGPGVDLRFCVAPADMVPGLVEQAQHRERIPLTAGLDDPTQQPQVDVILPDGLVGPAVAAAPAYLGQVRLLPSARDPLDDSAAAPAAVGGPVAVGGKEPIASGAGLALPLAARDNSTTGWTWAMAAFGQAEQRVAVERAIFRMAAPLIRTPDAEQEQVYAMPVTPDDVHAKRYGLDRLTLAANRERTLALARRMRLSSLAGGSVHPYEPDRPLADGEARSVAVWLDFDLDTPLVTAQPGAFVTGSARVALYSRASTNPVLVYLRLTGTLRVTDRSTFAGANGRPTTVVTTDFEGTADPLVVTVSVHDSPPQGVQLTIEWRFGVDDAGRPTLIALGPPGVSRALFEADEPDADTRRALLGTLDGQPTASGAGSDTNEAGPVLGLDVESGWTPHVGLGTSLPEPDRVLVSAQATRSADALAEGMTARDLAEAAIESISAELSPPDRDPGFGARARALLFPDAAGGPNAVTARRDWVLFHRRPVIDCATVPVPNAVRHYRAYHAVIDSLKDLPEFEKMLSLYAGNVADLIDTGGLAASTRSALRNRGALPWLRNRAAVDDLGFQLVDTVDFTVGTDELDTALTELRSLWSAADRGDALVWSAGGDVGPGDGADVVRRRVLAYRAALAGLIDLGNAPAPIVMSDIPDEFVGVGTDGAIFTVGLRAANTLPKPAQLALKLTRQQLAVLTKVLSGTPAPDEAAVRQALQAEQIEADYLVVEFDGDDVAADSQDDVRTWWALGSGPQGAAVWVDADVAASAGGTAAEQDRAAALVTLLGGPDDDAAPRTIGDVTSGNAITILLLPS